MDFISLFELEAGAEWEFRPALLFRVNRDFSFGKSLGQFS